MASVFTSSYPNYGDYSSSPVKTLAISPPKRNPITQSEISTPEFKRAKKVPPSYEITPNKTEGIGRAAYSEKGWRSFSFSYSTPEPYTFTKRMISPAPSEPVRGSTIRKKGEFSPTKRDPIIQKEVNLTPQKVRAKITESNIDLSFGREMEKTDELRIRQGPYFENMKSRVFNAPDVEKKICFKKVPTRASEVASIITYKDCQMKEESQAKKPNNYSMKKQDLAQKGTLTGLAKIYSEKMVKSQVVFN